MKALYYVLMKAQLGNRHVCQSLIREKHVQVNQKTITDFRYMVDQKDSIFVDKKPVSWPFVYYMMNKPKGYVCANKDNQYPCVIDLVDRKDCFCVGRLDKETTGLLLITNDSFFSKHLLLPQHHIEKTYAVTVDRSLHEGLADVFQEGVIIDKDTRCLPASIHILDQNHCHVTISQGMYHQVKKMFLSCGYQVMSLKRISFAHIPLDTTLKEGAYRPLTDQEWEKIEKMIS